MGREFHNLTLRLKDCKEMSTPQEFCGDDIKSIFSVGDASERMEP